MGNTYLRALSAYPSAFVTCPRADQYTAAAIHDSGDSVFASSESRTSSRNSPSAPQALHPPDTMKKKVSVVYIAMYGQTIRGNSPFWYKYGQSVSGMWWLGKTLT